MTEPDRHRTRGDEFKAVDNSGDPASLVSWLGSVAAVDAVEAAKGRSLELLALGAGDHAIDVGCGDGADIRRIAAAIGAHGRAVGVDSSETMIEAARSLAGAAGAEVEFVFADVLSLPFADCSFDAALTDRTLQHVPDPGAGLAEIARVTRPGGRVVVSEMLVSMNAVADDMVARTIAELVSNESDRTPWIGPRIPGLFEDAGLEQVTIETGAGTCRGYDAIERLYDPAALVGRAVGRRMLSGDEGDHLLGNLREVAEAGRIHVLLGTLHVSGRKPASAG